MNDQIPPAGPGGYSPQQPYIQPPAKKKHTVRNVVLIIIAVLILFIGGCMALIGGAANEVSKSIDKHDNSVGGPKNPLTIQVGKAFEVRGFNYAAGWKVGRDIAGDVDIKGLKVTNNRDDKDGALVEIKFWKGTEVLASADCTTDQIDVGTTVKVSCLSSDKLPKKYDKVTINDSF